MACLILGLLSATAFLHPVFWVVPALSVLAGWLAVRKQQPSRTGGGALLVLCGVTLAVGFGVAAGFSARQADALSEAQARRFAEYWLSRLQANDLATGLLLKAEPSKRPPQDTDLHAYFAADPARRRALHHFYEDDLARLLRLGQGIETRHEATVRLSRRLGEASLWYQIEYTDFSEKRRRTRVEIRLGYEFGDEPRVSGWWVRSAHLPLGYEFVEKTAEARTSGRSMP